MAQQNLNTCGCCEGKRHLTPLDTYNRPDRDSLSFRVGTHAAFFESMIADLAREEIELESFDADGKKIIEIIRPLQHLKTRRSDDFSIALLDIWAVLADVLAFYQERIANEGYLGTATERRSILELARLVGYQLRPGVAASTYLAFITEKSDHPILIPKHTRAQSLPGPGETIQSYETTFGLEARYAYNEMKLQSIRPQFIIPSNIPGSLYLPGKIINLRPGDGLLLAFSTSVINSMPGLTDQEKYFIARIQSTKPLDQPVRTQIDLQADISEIGNPLERVGNVPQDGMVVKNRFQKRDTLRLSREWSKHWYMDRPWTNVLKAIRHQSGIPTLQPVNVSGNTGDQNTSLQGAGALDPVFGENVYDVMRQEPAPLNGQQALGAVVLMRIQARLHGHNVPLRGFTQLSDSESHTVLKEWGDLTSTQGELSSLIAEIEKETNGIGDTTTKVDTWADGLDDSKKPELRSFIEKYRTSKSQLDSIITGHDGLKTLAQELPYGDQNHINEWKTLFNEGTITLDRIYPEIENEDRIVLVWQEVSQKRALFRVTNTDVVSTSLFNLPATVTRLAITKVVGDQWEPTKMEIIRSTTVYAGGELITNPVSYRVLAEEPAQEKDTYVTLKEENVNELAASLNVSVEALLAANEKTINPEEDVIAKGTELLLPLGKKLELDGIYRGLKPSRWIAVTGMRADIPVIGREVALLESVEHRFSRIVLADKEFDLPGDLRHTFLTLATPLNFPYLRSRVKISANVVPATHGETARGLPPDERDVILGSADSSKPRQSFPLGLSPGKRLTYVSAPTPDGVKSTLEVYVNNVCWHPVDTFIDCCKNDRAYVVRTEDDGQTSIIFGDGHRGARPPTGRENVFARYRVGIGKDGNVKAGQISLLATRPPGVKEVVNSTAATGGADPESRDQARENVKFSVRTLDRLVGLSDYEDFARTFAGIGKARACYDPDAQDEAGNVRGKITIYVGGEDNSPLEKDSELIQNLEKALDEYDGSDLWIDVETFTPRLLILDARVTISPDYLWEKVQPEIRTALEKTFAFARRELGQTVALSEVIAVIQQVDGVEHVHVIRFDALTIEQLEALASGASSGNLSVGPVMSFDDSVSHQAQLLFIDPSVPSLIALRESQTDR